MCCFGRPRVEEPQKPLREEWCLPEGSPRGSSVPASGRLVTSSRPPSVCAAHRKAPEAEKAELLFRLSQEYRRLGEKMPKGLKIASVPSQPPSEMSAAQVKTTQVPVPRNPRPRPVAPLMLAGLPASMQGPELLGGQVSKIEQVLADSTPAVAPKTLSRIRGPDGYPRFGSKVHDLLTKEAAVDVPALQAELSEKAQEVGAENAVLQDVDIVNQDRFVAVHLRCKGRPRVQGCHIESRGIGILAGLVIAGRCQGIFEACVISDCRSAGIRLRNDAQPVLRSNVVIGCRGDMSKFLMSRHYALVIRGLAAYSVMPANEASGIGGRSYGPENAAAPPAASSEWEVEDGATIAIVTAKEAYWLPDSSHLSDGEEVLNEKIEKTTYIDVFNVYKCIFVFFFKQFNILYHE
ncbi:unnamed protein product [Symbiodinium sp. KB8]|nr:unnamed protein product [Symbiodinium sp. KB8]